MRKETLDRANDLVVGIRVTERILEKINMKEHHLYAEINGKMVERLLNMVDGIAMRHIINSHLQDAHALLVGALQSKLRSLEKAFALLSD